MSVGEHHDAHPFKQGQSGRASGVADSLRPVEPRPGTLISMCTLGHSQDDGPGGRARGSQILSALHLHLKAWHIHVFCTVMREFVVKGPPARIIFGPGCVSRVGAAEIRTLGCKRLVMVGSVRSLKNIPAVVALQSELGDLVVGTIPRVKENVYGDLVEEAGKEVGRLRADALVVVGGGTALGLAKALANLLPLSSTGPSQMPSPLTIISIPTTYSGSEVTSYHGVSVVLNPAAQALIDKDANKPHGIKARKVAVRNQAVRPALVLYDAHFLQSLPYPLTISSLFNALAHAFEALWVNPMPSPQACWAASESVNIILRYIGNLDPSGRVADASESLVVVNELLYGAYLAAYSLDTEDLGLQHRLAHVLGGTYSVPHAQAHMLLLPHVLRFYEDAWADGGEKTTPLSHLKLGQAPSTQSLARCIFDIQRSLVHSKPPLSLQDVGLGQPDLEGVVDTLLEHGGIPVRQDVPISKPLLLGLLQHAISGESPPWEGRPASRTPRISYLSDQDFRAKDPEAASKIMARRHGQLLHLDRVLMHAPTVAQGWNAMFGSLRSGLRSIDGRLRELVILRVAVVNQAYYEYFQHYPVFLKEGGSVPEAEALGNWRSEASKHLFGAKDRAVLAYVDEMTGRIQVQDKTVKILFATASTEAPESFVVELTALCAGYNMVSRFLEALHLTAESENSAALPRMPVDIHSTLGN